MSAGVAGWDPARVRGVVEDLWGAVRGDSGLETGSHGHPCYSPRRADILALLRALREGEVKVVPAAPSP